MTIPRNEAQPAVTVIDRITSYKTVIPKMVSLGVEHPQYEFKRAVTLKREALPDRLDFVKLVQGMANSHVEGERFIVIGADQAGRRFQAVANQDEFDPATVNQILSKYLEPAPEIEVFPLQTPPSERELL